MYRRRRAQRKPTYNYSSEQYPELCKQTMTNKHTNWEHILATSKEEETMEVENNIFDNNAFLEVEEIIQELEERNETYKWEDEMRYGIGRMNEWDRGYYNGNPYIYSWEFEKMQFFTEASEGEMEDDELD